VEHGAFLLDRSRVSVGRYRGEPPVQGRLHEVVADLAGIEDRETRHDNEVALVEGLTSCRTRGRLLQTGEGAAREELGEGA
jgi:hypothetical protein